MKHKQETLKLKTNWKGLKRIALPCFALPELFIYACFLSGRQEIKFSLICVKNMIRHNIYTYAGMQQRFHQHDNCTISKFAIHNKTSWSLKIQQFSQHGPLSFLPRSVPSADSIANVNPGDFANTGNGRTRCNGDSSSSDHARGKTNDNRVSGPSCNNCGT